MVDKIAAALGIISSALFEENQCPENVKLQYAQKFGKKLEEELVSRIEIAVKDVCKSV